MVGSLDVSWLGDAVSLSIFCLVVLVMAEWWPTKAATATASVPVGGGPEHDDELLETRVRELETAGDLDGVTALLLSAWTKQGSSRAVTLAHELSKRHPAEAFQMGCPLQQGNRDLNVRPEREHDAGAADDSLAVTTLAGSTRSDAFAADTGIDLAAGKVSGEDDERGSPSAALTPARKGRGGGEAFPTSNIAEATPPTSKVGNDGDVRGGGGSDGEAPSPATPTRSTSSTSNTDTAQTTPWERGWQGPKGFKPPPSSSFSNTASNSSPSPGFGSSSLSPRKRDAEEGDLGAAVPRNFTVLQLNAFDGGVPAPVVRGGETRAKEPRPIYIALRGDVYDASAGRNLYGPGGEYSEFAGHDISRRVARGIKDAGSTSDESAPLDDLSLESLGRFENMTLRGWEDTFKARGYPRVGRVVTPPPPRLFSRADLRPFDGRALAGAASDGAAGGGGQGEETGGGGERQGGEGVEGEASEGPVPVPVPKSMSMPMPAGYAARSIYVGVRDKVFDVSFGGSEFYVEGGPYECLAGRDASRVLAKMSMKPEDVEGVLDYAALNDREEKNLADWVGKLGEGEGGRGYPIVGWIDMNV